MLNWHHCGMTRKVAAEQRGDHGDTKKNDTTESTRTEYYAAPHDHNVMNWGVMLTRVVMQIQEQELRKMILA
jgi:hypothetical protein